MNTESIIRNVLRDDLVRNASVLLRRNKKPFLRYYSDFALTSAFIAIDAMARTEVDGDEIGTKEAKKMKIELQREALRSGRELGRQLVDPEKLRAFVEMGMKSSYLSYQETQTEIRLQLSKLRRLGILNTPISNKFSNAGEAALRRARVNDKIVGGLVSIAQKSGLDVALAEDTIYRVVREVLPTPADYRVYARGSAVTFPSLGDDGARMKQNAGIVRKIYPKILKEGTRLGRRLSAETRKSNNEYLRVQIARIYGSKR
jgi:hypothetical protein